MLWVVNDMMITYRWSSIEGIVNPLTCGDRINLVQQS